MENNLENLNPEPYQPYPISALVLNETKQFLEKASDPKLQFGKWETLCEEFERKAKANPEYRLAYLRQSTQSPDMYILAEIHELENQLRRNS